jgi:tetratricopeptide (TPR) repeat protein
MACFHTALEILTGLGDRFGQAMLLQGLGELHPDPVQAQAYLERGLLLSRELHNRFAEARGLRCLGDLHHSQGREQQAEQCLRKSVDLWRQLRMPLYEARTLDRLGVVHAAAGRRQPAAATWRQALTIFQTVGAPEASTVAARLTAWTPGPSRR